MMGIDVKKGHLLCWGAIDFDFGLPISALPDLIEIIREDQIKSTFNAR